MPYFNKNRGFKLGGFKPHNHSNKKSPYEKWKSYNVDESTRSFIERMRFTNPDDIAHQERFLKDTSGIKEGQRKTLSYDTQGHGITGRHESHSPDTDRWYTSSSTTQSGGLKNKAYNEFLERTTGIATEKMKPKKELVGNVTVDFDEMDRLNRPQAQTTSSNRKPIQHATVTSNEKGETIVTPRDKDETIVDTAKEGGNFVQEVDQRNLTTADAGKKEYVPQSQRGKNKTKTTKKVNVKPKVDLSAKLDEYIPQSMRKA
tara:strand:- start:1730 stop:2506 length:777 start_codon:yes stop_codon:yes gene_type:complete